MFYFAQLRASYDIGRCNDLSARGAAADAMIRKYGGQINKHTFIDLKRPNKAMKDVKALDLKYQYNYKHRLVHLYGAVKFTSDKTEVAPNSKWQKF